jgi:hypothetical protein
MTRTAPAARRDSHGTVATRQKHHPEATGVRGSVYRKRPNPKSGGLIDRRLEKEFTGKRRIMIRKRRKSRIMIKSRI